MNIKLALAANNTEKCFEVGIFGIENYKTSIVNRFLTLCQGDILVFYKAGAGFAGIWEVFGENYSDKSIIWEDGIYPLRIKIKPIIALKPDQYIDVKPFVNDLKMIKNPYYWGLAFVDNFKDIPYEDYLLIKNKLEMAKNKLTEKELTVLEDLAAGYSNDDIAFVLETDVRSVQTMLTNLFQKLGAKNKKQAVTKYREIYG